MTGESPPKASRFLSPANALTTLRLLLAPLTAMLLYQGALSVAAVLFTLAALSDFYDGRLARARKESTAFGAIFDHATDALFVTATLLAAARLEQIPPLLPLLIPLAFLQYLLDSRALAGQQLRANALGRWNGLAYFVLCGCCIGLPLLINLTGVPLGAATLLWPLGAVLCLTTALSMTDRALTWWRLR